MDPTLLLTLLAIILLIFLSGMFSGSETALTAASQARMMVLGKEGEQRAVLVNELIQDRERLIGAILLGNNLVNILASVLATRAFLILFGDAGLVYATLIMTAMILIFAEVLPKTYAIANADRLAMTVAPIMKVAALLFAPVVGLVQWIVRKTLALFGMTVDKDQRILSPHEEIRGAIDLHHQEGRVMKTDRDMLGGILDLGDLTVDEVMVHRKNMVMIDSSLPSGDIINEALKSPYTRIPLWRNTPEEIIGILYAKDLLRALIANKGDIDSLDIKALLTEPWFVPETTTLKEQLNAFLKQRKHFALVVDEYGALQGLVTLEDILEEIVGDITDEYDASTIGVRPQPNGAVYVDGDVTIRDLNRAMDWSLPDDEANTIAGLVIHEAQTIPEPGQIFSYYGYRFEILRRHRNQITALRIIPPPRTEKAATAP